MKNKYNCTSTSVSLLRYHFIFCPYRRRKIFDIPFVEERFKVLLMECCHTNGFEVIALECHHDHVHLFLSAPPKWSPAQIMHAIKGFTSHAIRKEFSVLSHGTTLWTRSYFVSTAGDVSAATINRYVETQKTR